MVASCEVTPTDASAMSSATSARSRCRRAMITRRVPARPLLGIHPAFLDPAKEGILPQIFPDEALARANGMMQSMWSLSGLLSPSIAATIIALPALLRQGGMTGGTAQLQDGSALTMLIDAATFLIAAGALIFLAIPSPTRSDWQATNGRPKQSLMADVKEGARYIWYRRPMLWLLGTFAVLNLLAAPIGVFEPLLLKFNLAADWSARGMTFEAGLATLATIGSLGGLLGGVAVSAWGGLKKKRVYGVLVPIVIESLAMIGLGLSAALFVASIAIFVSTAMIPVMNSHSQTIWQTQTPHELQGRVFAVRRLIAQFTAPLGTALAGWTGGQFDPGAVIASLGIILLIFGVVQLFNPYLLRVEDKAWLDEMAAEREAQRAGV